MISDKVLFIGHNWPEIQSTAAGRRTYELLNWFLKQKSSITFVSAAQSSEYSKSFFTLPISCIKIKMNDSSFDVFLKDLKPDFVVFDRFLTEEQFGPRVAETCPGAIRILDTSDLHSLRYTRQKLFKENKKFSPLEWMSQDITRREIASIYRSDLTLVISKYEMKLLKKWGGINSKLLFFLPFLAKKTAIKKNTSHPAFKEREHFMFVGNGKHQPNVDGLIWLITEIWPIIKKEIPEAELHIYGPYMPQKVINLFNSKNGIYGKGWTDNLVKTMQLHRVNLIPLTYGAGVKGKLIEGLENKIPLISTSIGAEGFKGIRYLKSYIEDKPKAFASKAVNLYTFEDAWEKALSKGDKMLKKQKSETSWDLSLEFRLSKLRKDIEEYRTYNVIGRILSRQEYQSNKYMSKWIEVKNQFLEFKNKTIEPTSES